MVGGFDDAFSAIADVTRKAVALPDLRELSAAFQAANTKLDQAWAHTLTSAKVQP